MFVPTIKGLLKRSPFFTSLIFLFFTGMAPDTALSQTTGSTKSVENQTPLNLDINSPLSSSTEQKIIKPDSSYETDDQQNLQLSPVVEAPPQHQKALWGLGLGFGWLPNYAGAKKSNFQYLPFPIYRGDRFRIDRLDGVSGRVGNTSQIKLSWSFIFQFPIEAKEIEVRRGMSDLDWFLGIGPLVKYTFWKKGKNEFFLRVPLRPNFCTNFRSTFQFCGLDVSPGLRFNHDLKKGGSIMYRFEAYSYTKEYHRYYYGVPRADATPERPAFDARPGFLGFLAGAVHTLPMKYWDFVTMATFYDYSLAVNRESPLFESPYNWALFFAVSVDLFK